MPDDTAQTPTSDVEKAASIVAIPIATAGAFVMFGLMSRPSMPNSGIWIKRGIESLGKDIKDGFEIQG